MRRGQIAAILIILLAMMVGIGIWFGVSYNQLVQKEEQLKEAWAQVESNIQRKADLLPRLYKLVGSYMRHEKEVYEQITALRAKQGSQKLDPRQLLQTKRKIDTLATQLFAVAERYPELRSSEQFLQLQSQVEGSENRINIARMRYNEAVKEYNAYLRRFPTNIVANLGGFTQKPYFVATSKKIETEL